MAELMRFDNDEGEEQRLPRNVEAEATFLGALLIDNRVAEDVQIKLRPDHFYEPLHGRIYEQALKLRALRNNVLSSNIANADTPNFKARDVDFGTALKRESASQLSLVKTSALHRNAWGTNSLGASVKYRIPTQPTLDGNTVETDVEQAAFAENAVQYRATLAFLDGRIRTLRYALKGGD